MPESAGGQTPPATSPVKPRPCEVAERGRDEGDCDDAHEAKGAWCLINLATDALTRPSGICAGTAPTLPSDVVDPAYVTGLKIRGGGDEHVTADGIMGANARSPSPNSRSAKRE
jgi:hypothetical protein